MPRPYKEGLDYFPHDTDASEDIALELMEAHYGLAGYGFYFKLLERIYRSANCCLDLGNEVAVKMLARKWGIRADFFLKMVSTAVEVGLFDASKWHVDRSLTSRGIEKRFSLVVKQRVAWRQKQNQTQELSPEITQEETREETPVIPLDKVIYKVIIKEKQKKRSIRKEEEEETTAASASSPQAKRPETELLLEYFTELYEQNIGTLTPQIKKELSALANNGCRHDYFAFAVKEAAECNVLTWHYIKAVLARLDRDGLDSDIPPGVDPVEFREKTKNLLQQNDQFLLNHPHPETLTPANQRRRQELLAQTHPEILTTRGEYGTEIAAHIGVGK